MIELELSSARQGAKGAARAPSERSAAQAPSERSAAQAPSERSAAQAPSERSDLSAEGRCCMRCQQGAPIFVDFIEDYARDRAMAVIGMVFLLALVVFPSSMDLSAGAVLDALTFASPPQHFASINVPAGRAPRLYAKFASGLTPVAGEVTVEARVAQVVINDPSQTLDCSTQFLSTIKGTLEEIRYEDACQTRISNGTAANDRAGVVSFEGMAIDGPEGEYTVKFIATKDNVAAKAVMRMVPTVFSLAVTNRPALLDPSGKGADLTAHERSKIVQDALAAGVDGLLPRFRIGQPLEIQPEIQLFGDRGKPIAGVRVSAFAWDYPSFEYRDKIGLVDSNKMPYYWRGRVPFPGARVAALSGATSEPSDSSGVARFTDLAITGTTHDSVYLMFYAQGKIVSWSKPQGYSNPSLNTAFRMPLLIDTQDAHHPQSLAVTAGTVPTKTMEGEKFNRQPIVTVSPARAGAKIFAVITRRGFGGDAASPLGRQEPYGFTSPSALPELAIKRLVNAVAETDADGVAKFTKLGFQRDGAHGDYEINFVCDGRWAPKAHKIVVQSSVANVLVLSQDVSVPLAGVYELSRSGSGLQEQKSASFIVRATDASGHGLAGKAPFTELFRNDSGILVPVDPVNEAAVTMMHTPVPQAGTISSTFTGFDGLAEVRVFFSQINEKLLCAISSKGHSCNTTRNSTERLFVRFGFDGGRDVATSTFIGPISPARDEPPYPLFAQPSLARVVGINDDVGGSTRIVSSPMVNVGERFSIEIELRTPEGDVPKHVDFAAVLCQDDFRPNPNPFRIALHDRSTNTAMRDYAGEVFSGLKKCDPANVGHNIKCVDKNGRMTLDVAVIAAPAANQDYDPASPALDRGTSSLGWRVLLLGSNSSARPGCDAFSGQAINADTGLPFDPFCKAMTGMDEGGVASICRASGGAPHATPVGVAYGFDASGVVAVTAATPTVVTPVRQRIASLDVVGSMKFPSPFDPAASFDFESVNRSRFQRFFPLTLDRHSSFMYIFKSVTPFFKAMGHASASTDSREQLEGIAADGTAQIRMLHVPENLPFVSTFNTKNEQQLSTQPDWSALEGFALDEWKRDGQIVLGSLFSNDARLAGGEGCDGISPPGLAKIFSPEFFDADSCPQENPLNGGRYIANVTHVFRSFGSFDVHDPACLNYCSKIPWVVHAEPLAGTQNVPKEKTAGVQLQGPHFWTQFGITFPGTYIFQLEIDGVSSIPISVKVPVVVSKIEIVTQPQARAGVHWSEGFVRPGDLLEVVPTVRTTLFQGNWSCTFDTTRSLTDRDANCVREGGVVTAIGFPVQMAWVNDDLTPAPALADLIEEPLTRGDKSADEPYASKIGTFSSSNPASGGGIARFVRASIVNARSGCYRAVFFVPNAQPFSWKPSISETIFAGKRVHRDDGSDATFDYDGQRATRWIPTMSDPVCILNEESIDVTEKPSSVASPGTDIPTPPAITVSSPRDFVADDGDILDVCYPWKRGYLRLLQMSTRILLVDSIGTSRKVEPSLNRLWARALKRWSGIKTDSTNGTQDADLADDSMRVGDTVVGMLQESIKLSNSRCTSYLGYNVEGKLCTPTGGTVSNLFGSKMSLIPVGGYLLYDLNDGKIKLVDTANCEFVPYVVDSELQQFGETGNPWAAYNTRCARIADDWEDVSPGQGASWNITGAPPWGKYFKSWGRGDFWWAQFAKEMEFEADAVGCSSYSHKCTVRAFGTDFPLLSGTTAVRPNNWVEGSFSPNIVMDLQDGNGPFNFTEKMTQIFGACASANPASAHPDYIEREVASKSFPDGPGITMAVGRTTSRYDERVTRDIVHSVRFEKLQVQNSNNGEVLNLKAYDSLVAGRPGAYNLKTERYDPTTANRDCSGPLPKGSSKGAFSDCCDAHDDCGQGLLCHPVHKSCTRQCSDAPFTKEGRTFFQTSEAQCPEESLTQRRLCQLLKPSYGETLMAVEGIKSRMSDPLVATNGVYLCASRKAVGSSFAVSFLSIPLQSLSLSLTCSPE